ncbi:hypothetical protein L2E82_50460 [Cichorium intybus]|nr:hypothetical protein L2E82_50460 [Cichorium intybus]
MGFDSGSGPLHPLVVSLATRFSGCVAAPASHSFDTASVCVAKGKYVGLGWFEHGDGGILMPWGEVLVCALSQMSKSMPKVLFARVQRYSQLHYNKLLITEKYYIGAFELLSKTAPIQALSLLVFVETSSRIGLLGKRCTNFVVTPNGIGTLLCAVGKQQGNQAWEQEQELQDTKEDMEMQ